MSASEVQGCGLHPYSGIRNGTTQMSCTCIITWFAHSKGASISMEDVIHQTKCSISLFFSIQAQSFRPFQARKINFWNSPAFPCLEKHETMMMIEDAENDEDDDDNDNNNNIWMFINADTYLSYNLPVLMWYFVLSPFPDFCKNKNIQIWLSAWNRVYPIDNTTNRIPTRGQ